MTRPRVHLVIATTFGVLLILSGIAVIIVSVRDETLDQLLALLGALLLILLGLDMIISVRQGRDSILDRIGPLP